MSESQVLEARARSAMYGLLARLLRQEVDAELLAELRSPEMVEALADAGLRVNELLPAGEDTLLLEQLAQSYTYLFLLTLSPHESVRRGEGQLWGQRTAEVQAFLNGLGLSAAGERSLLPDHIAVELEIMQHLTATEAALLENGDGDGASLAVDQQRRFMREHLGVWGVEFMGAVQRISNHPFFREVGALGVAYLFDEQKRLK